MAETIHRRPNEDWTAYTKRLEVERLKIIAANKSKEAAALESLPQEYRDLETKTTARAKRAAAEEFFKAVEEIERGEK